MQCLECLLGENHFPCNLQNSELVYTSIGAHMHKIINKHLPTVQIQFVRVGYTIYGQDTYKLTEWNFLTCSDIWQQNAWRRTLCLLKVKRKNDVLAIVNP